LKKALIFDPISGAAGDMILGALFDLGVPVDYVDRNIRSTDLSEFGINFNRFTDHTGLTSGKCDIPIRETHHHRRLSDIEKIIMRGDFSEDVKNNAVRTFRRLAEAEAKVHNVSIDEVHFHEVGAVDAIVDILGSMIAIDYLKPEKIYCGPFKLGRGTINCAHGEIPNPAPATVELIRGFPAISLPIDAELTTPTGAAILTTICEGEFSEIPFIIKAIGYGAGRTKLERRPNVIRALAVDIRNDAPNQDVEIIETDIDDESPELVASLTERLRADSNVRDVTVQHIIMKKGRPGFRLTAIADKDKASGIADILFRHSSTIGVRIHSARRIILPRSEVTVKTKWGDIQAKRVERPDRIEIVPEYEECRKVALDNNISIREVMNEVIRNA